MHTPVELCSSRAAHVFRKRSGCAIFGTCALIRSNTEEKKIISIHLDQSQKQARGLNFWLEMKVRVVKTKVLVSCPVTAQLICAFVFA